MFPLTRRRVKEIGDWGYWGLNCGLRIDCDSRQSGKSIHELPDLFSQRIFGIACGYSDCNDAARLAEDPGSKMGAKGAKRIWLTSETTRYFVV
ncbi:MAG: transposase [Acidobacteriota bacterium]